MEELVCRKMRPLTQAIGILRGKWTVPILFVLLDGPVRLSQLKRRIPRASKKALTAHLKILQRAQIISRRDLSTSVLHVEYELVATAKEPLTQLFLNLAKLSGVPSPNESTPKHLES